MFKVVTQLEDLIKVFVVRGIVFIEEQGVPYALEHDSEEYRSMHILGEENEVPFGAGRIRFLGEYAKLERIAIRKGYRGRNLGHELTQFMMATAEAHGFKKFKLHAQAHLAEFYQKHGFRISGEKFREAEIDHYPMSRES